MDIGKMKYNQLRSCILAYETRHDLEMLLMYNEPKDLIVANNDVINEHKTNDAFVIDAKRLLIELETIYTSEEYS